MKKHKFLKVLIVLGISVFVASCQQSSNSANEAKIDSLVNAKVAEKTEAIEAKAREEAEEKVKQEQEAREREAQAQLESVRPSGNSLREREMRFYFDAGYDFGTHPTYSKMDDEKMHTAFLLVVSHHDMSHANNANLERSFMAGVAKGRAELKDLQH